GLEDTFRDKVVIKTCNISLVRYLPKTVEDRRKLKKFFATQIGYKLFKVFAGGDQLRKIEVKERLLYLWQTPNGYIALKPGLFPRSNLQITGRKIIHLAAEFPADKNIKVRHVHFWSKKGNISGGRSEEHTSELQS